ncbi:glycosyltransferase [Aquirufa sp. 5-AUSEE-100C1]
MRQKEHLLHVCSYSYESGGPASVILNHSQFQVASGLDVSIASSMEVHHHPYPTAPGVHLHVFRPSFWSRFLSEFSWSLFFWFIKNRNKYDYIHIHGLWYFGSILPFLVPSRAKKIVTVHGFLDTYAFQRSAWKKRLLWNLIQKRYLRSADMIHVISREEEHILLQLFPDLRSKIVFIPNGILDPMASAIEEPSAEFVNRIQGIQRNGSFVYLFLSRINRKKGIDILVDAFEQLSKKHGEKVQLIIAGPVDDYSIALQERMAKYPLTNIHLFDVVTGANKAFLLNEVDAFVLPSYSEGFSIAALEALAYSKPAILSTRVGFATELISANAALICEPELNSLYAGLSRIYLEEDYRNQLGSNARRLFLDHYQIKQVAQDFLIAMKQI